MCFVIDFDVTFVAVLATFLNHKRTHLNLHLSLRIHLRIHLEYRWTLFIVFRVSYILCNNTRAMTTADAGARSS